MYYAQIIEYACAQYYLKLFGVSILCIYQGVHLVVSIIYEPYTYLGYHVHITTFMSCLMILILHEKEEFMYYSLCFAWIHDHLASIGHFSLQIGFDQ